MALTSNIPKDIRKYDSKFLGPLTFRQTICVGIGTITGGGAFYLFKDILGTTNASFMIFIMIALCMTFTLKPYGMKFEQYLFNFMKDNVLSATKRKYSTSNYYIKLNKPYIEIQYDKKGKPIKVKEKKKKKLKSKYIPIK